MMNGDNDDDNADDNDDDNADDNADDIAQEIMMLLIGESSMSHAHLVNGAVVNVRARVRLIFSFLMMIGFDKVVSDIYCFHWKSDRCPIQQGDKLGVWLADAREEEGVSCHNHNHCYNHNQNHKKMTLKDP